MTRGSTVRTRSSLPVHMELRVKQEQYIEAKKLPSEILVDLWAARFGHEWVDIKEVQTDDLFCAIAQRLIMELHLERKTLLNNVRTVLRLAEG